MTNQATYVTMFMGHNDVCANSFADITPVAALTGLIALYAALGALIHLRNLPSIVVTLGMSFVWLGLAVLVLPTPGGKAPEYIRALMTLKPPVIPFPIIASVVIALVVHVALMRSAWVLSCAAPAAIRDRWNAQAGRF